jgi:signal recognition particle subunit SEC65
MSDSFKSDQFDWLRQVASDAGLVPAAARVAIALTRYFNRKHDGWAWMAQATLASDLGMPERTVCDAIARLVKNGHLVTKQRGHMATNLYHLVLKNTDSDRQPSASHDRQTTAGHDRQPTAAHTGVTGRKQQGDRQPSAAMTGSHLPPNPMNEPYEEPNEVESDSPPDLGEEDSGRRSRSPSSETATDAGFETFWEAYPKRVDKAKARVAYRRVVAAKKVTVEELLNGAMRYAAERLGQDPRYSKHPTTWLNAESWNNEPASTGATYSAAQPESPHIAIAEQIARQLMEKDGGRVQ